MRIPWNPFFLIATKLLQANWQAMVNDYLRRFPPKHYQLYHATLAFPQFLSQQSQAMEHYPFLYDLARYELLEATILRWPDDPLTATMPLGNNFKPWHKHRPVLNSAGQFLTTPYPLADIVACLQSDLADDEDLAPFVTPGPTVTLWVYRDANQQCRFFKVGGVIQAFLQACLQASPSASYHELWQELTQQFNLTSDDALDTQWVTMVTQLEAVGIVRGSLLI
jgi:hypothetical protein